jgi:hypothetical protein
VGCNEKVKGVVLVVMGNSFSLPPKLPPGKRGAASVPPLQHQGELERVANGLKSTSSNLSAFSTSSSRPKYFFPKSPRQDNVVPCSSNNNG